MARGKDVGALEEDGERDLGFLAGLDDVRRGNVDWGPFYILQ
jgi:hypothetical protein